MRKVLSGVMGLVMTGAVVTASAYALWSAQATVSGFNFNTGSLSLLVSADGTNFDDAINVSALSVNNAFPGFEDFTTFYIQNDSEEDLDISTRLVSADVWDAALAAEVEMAVVPEGGTPDTDGSTPDTSDDYKSLADWNAAEHAFSPALPANTTVPMDVYIRLPEDADTSLQGKSLENITFTITGTQVVTP